MSKVFIFKGGIMPKTVKAYITKDSMAGLSIYIAQYDGDKPYAIAERMMFKAIINDGMVGEPTIHLPYNDTALLQSIVDQAWDLGIRPRYGNDTALLQSIVDQAWDLGIRPRYGKETTK